MRGGAEGQGHSMAAHDTAFKAILQYQPEAFVAKFLPGATYVAMLPTELAREPLRADALLRVRFPADNAEYILHIEVQSGADDEMPRRLCTYALLAYEREKLPVLSIVIYLLPCRTPTPPWVMSGPEHAIITYDYRVVRLWDESLDDWLTAGLSGLLIFAPLLKGASLERMDEIVGAFENIADPVQRNNSLHYLIQFANRRFGVQAVLDYLEGNPVLDQFLQDSELTQIFIQRGLEKGVAQGLEIGVAQGLEQGREQGREQGLEQGLEQGREQGREQGVAQGEIKAAQTMITAVVARRFPALQQEVEEKIATISDPAVLQEMAVQTAIASDEAAVRQALGLSHP